MVLGYDSFICNSEGKRVFLKKVKSQLKNTFQKRQAVQLLEHTSESKCKPLLQYWQQKDFESLISILKVFYW